MIGDPSGKSSERNLLDADALAANVVAIRAQLGRFLDFDEGPSGAILANNADWFRDIQYLDFLRDIGKHLTINYMVAKEAVRARLEDRDSGISYTEFSYMLLQAYDFVHLARHLACRLQVGGSDQWGNITAGTELQHKLGRPRIYALVAPLLLDSGGQKMGKTSTGERVWLDPNLMSPYAFFQYFLNIADADVAKLLKIFSWRPLSEIDELLRVHAIDLGKRTAQRALAEEMTTWVHGADGTRRALAASGVMFGGSLATLRDADLAPLLVSDVKSTTIPRSELAAGIAIVDLLHRIELAPSKGAARRLLEQGGVYLNNVRVDRADLLVTVQHLATESMLLLRAGKKSYHVVRTI
jgi:tyrosyl-tRNA synthetase